MIDKSASIVLAHDCVVYASHAVVSILTTSATQHLSAARRSGYEAIILASTNITLQRSPPLNPATFLPMIDDISDHDCHAVISECTSPRPDLLQTPIPNSDMVLYTDGSASRHLITFIWPAMLLSLILMFWKLMCCHDTPLLKQRN